MIPVKNEYQRIMAQIDELIKKGNGTISPSDLLQYQQLAKAAQAYEQHVYVIDAPTTLEGLLEWKMYELKLKQRDLAIKLHVSSTKLSLIMSGKQKPDATLLKTIHMELGIDGNVLLEAI